MKFTANFYARMLVAIGLAYAAFSFGNRNSASPPTADERWATSLLMLASAAIGLIMAPYVILHPIRRVTRMIRTMPIVELVAIGLEILAGLIVAVLVTVPLSRLPGLLGAYSPLAAALLLAYLGSALGASRKNDILEFTRAEWRSRGASNGVEPRTVVDTSVIVDGRIVDVVKAGFMRGKLLVPQFVLHELQQLADSGDDLTRAKGKRGLDVLRGLQESKEVEIDVMDVRLATQRDVDDKLVALARMERVPLLTNDSNLEHVAQLQGVPVLNLNKLADALRTPYAAGDQIRVIIRSEGREREQGVGFSDDGTMIVVEDARSLVGHEVAATVTRIYATQTGRIIFAQLERSNGRPRS